MCFIPSLYIQVSFSVEFNCITTTCSRSLMMTWVLKFAVANNYSQESRLARWSSKEPGSEAVSVC